MNARMYSLFTILALTGALTACGNDRTDTSATDGIGPDSTAQNTPGMGDDTTAGTYNEGMTPGTGATDTMGDTMGSAGAPGATDDAMLAAAVKSALEADTQLAGNQISVEIVGGQVILTGQVDNNDEVHRATEIVTTVEGVSSVDNRLTVSST